MNVQVGAMANVAIMLCITIWALYLIFKNKAEITQHLLSLAERSLAFLACLSAPLRWCGTGWPALTLSCCFLLVIRPGNSLKFMMGATVRSLAIIGIAAFISGMFTRWIAKTITLSPHTQRNYPELQKRLNGWLSSALKSHAF